MRCTTCVIDDCGTSVLTDVVVSTKGNKGKGEERKAIAPQLVSTKRETGDRKGGYK